jgi:CheY-like chemotaxis protein
MSEDVKLRAFEPFFTTKEVGKGSGLGLSQAYGFAQSSRGEIEIDSAPGRGTTVTLHLPATSVRPEAKKPISEGPRHMPDERSILVIEDDPSLAAVTEALISDAGYAVKLVHSAHEALDCLRADGGRNIGAIFSDVVMPGRMNGFELSRLVKREFPQIPMLLTSGYSGAVAAQDQEGVRVLAKPYEPDELFAALEAMIAEARPATTI